VRLPLEIFTYPKQAKLPRSEFNLQLDFETPGDKEQLSADDSKKEHREEVLGVFE
jgi:hypothetical protein